MADTSTVPQGARAGTAGLSPTLAIYHKRALLDYIKFNSRYENFGLEDTVPLRNGDQCVFTRLDGYAAGTAPTALTEGNTPASTAMSSLSVTAQIKEYGTWTEKSDFLRKVSFVDWIPTASEWLNYRAMIDIDMLCRDELSSNAVSGSGGNIMVAGALTATALSSVTSASYLVASDFLGANIKMRKLGIMPFAGQDFGSVVATACLYDLQSDASAGGWIDILKYNNTNMQIINGEAGKVHGVRITDSPLAVSTSTGTSASATAWYNFVFGKGSFGKVKLSGSDIDLVVRLAKDNGIEDPLGQRNSVGVIYPFVAKYLKTSMSTDKHRMVVLLAASRASGL